MPHIERGAAKARLDLFGAGRRPYALRCPGGIRCGHGLGWTLEGATELRQANAEKRIELANDFGKTGGSNRGLPGCKHVGSRGGNDSVEIAKAVVEGRLGVAGMGFRDQSGPRGCGIEFMLGIEPPRALRGP